MQMILLPSRLFHLAQEGLVDGEPGDGVEAQVCEVVDVAPLPGFRSKGAAAAHVRINGAADDVVRHDGPHGHRAPRALDSHLVAVADPASGRRDVLAWEDLRRHGIAWYAARGLDFAALNRKLARQLERT